MTSLHVPQRARPRLLAATAALMVMPLALGAQATPGRTGSAGPASAPSIFAATIPERDAKTPNLSTEELRRLLGDTAIVLLDNRPFAEFALGHLPGALNVAPKPGMPMSEYTSDVAEVDRLLKGDRSRPLVLYCAGPFCGKSSRVAADLLAAGYENVRRYQLGAPVWRALGGVMVIEPAGVRHVLENDRTAWLVDARPPEAARADSIAGARNVWSGQVPEAKNDGRVPMQDHNARIIVFGADGGQARGVAEELTRNAFHNVAYFEGDVTAFRAALAPEAPARPRIVRADAVAAPAKGAVAQETVHESGRMVSRIMRLAPGASIAEHHHPLFDETLTVQRGRLQLMLDGDPHDLGAGDVVFIPAGTVIAGRNAAEGETVMVVVFASAGREGPLTVPGKPGHTP